MSEKYQTRQRKLLQNYLAKHVDEPLSAREIASALASDGLNLSTVYRNLRALENEKILSRFSLPGSREVRYRFSIGKRCEGHLHLSCRACGKTFHLDETTGAAFAKAVSTKGGFQIDLSDTTIYGFCARCGHKNLIRKTKTGKMT